MPANEQTRNIINKESIAKMKDGVRIINLARGELVDEESMIEALNQEKVARYVTDFATYQLVHTKNTDLFPASGCFHAGERRKLRGHGSEGIT